MRLLNNKKDSCIGFDPAKPINKKMLILPREIEAHVTSRIINGHFNL